MSLHFAPPDAALGWAWGTHGSPIVVGRGRQKKHGPFGEVGLGYQLTAENPQDPFLHEGFGPEAIDPQGPPPAERTLPAWALVGIVGAVCAVVGVAIYYKYKLTSEIARKHGIGKALAFEAGTEAIGVLGSRMRRNGRDPPRGFRYRYIPGGRPGEGQLVLEKAPPGWKPPRMRAGIRKKRYR